MNRMQIRSMMADCLTQHGVDTDSLNSGRYYLTIGGVWAGATTDDRLTAYEWYLRATEEAFLQHNDADVCLKAKEGRLPSDNDETIATF